MIRSKALTMALAAVFAGAAAGLATPGTALAAPGKAPAPVAQMSPGDTGQVYKSDCFKRRLWPSRSCSHRMETTAQVSNGKVSATTVLKAGEITGFRGCVTVTLLNSAQAPVWWTEAECWGVGADVDVDARTERSESWIQTVPAEALAETVGLEIRHNRS